MGIALIPARLRAGGGTRIHWRRPPRAALAVVPVRLRGFTRDTRGGGSIELALGGLVLISSSLLCFDLYSRVEADTAIARMAITMADYVSRDVDPDGDEMKALGRYLHANELRVPANVVYVVTAIHQPPGAPRPDAVVLWSDDTIRIGDPATTADIAAECARFVGDGGAADLPDGFTMSDDEVLVIAEVCAGLTREGFLTDKLITGGVYGLHALPARDPDQRPAAPAYAGRAATYATAAAGAAPGRGAGARPGRPRRHRERPQAHDRARPRIRLEPRRRGTPAHSSIGTATRSLEMKTMQAKKTKHISRRFRRFARANEAAGALEYALVVGLVSTAIAAGLVTFGGTITDLLTTIGAEVTEAENAAKD